MKKSANREQRQRTYLTDNSYIWDGYGELSRQRHQIRRGRRRGAGPAAGKGAGHPHAGRYALPLSVPLHRPYEDLPHRPDRGRGFRTHPVPGAHHRRQLCRSGAQTTFHGRRERRQRRGRTGLVPGNQMDRKTDRSGARIPDFRPPILLQGRTVGGTSRNRNHRESLFPQGRKRSARHLLLDRAAFERPRHQRHLHDRLQPLADGAGPYPRNAARPNADPVRSAVAARCALQHPFSAIARTAAAGTIPAEVRRATRHSTGYPIAPHGPPVEKQRIPLPQSGRRIQYLLQHQAAVPADRGAEARGQGDPAGHDLRLPDEPPAARRRGQRQDPRGVDVHAAGRR